MRFKIILSLSVSAIFFFLISFPIFSFAETKDIVAEGSCGDNLQWYLYTDNSLEIIGEGDMYDYTYRTNEGECKTPWENYQRVISKVVLDDKITSIGACAFGNCCNLIEINIPENVEKISNRAFSNCRSLNEINIPDKVAYIGRNAFEGCIGITSIFIPKSVNKIYALEREWSPFFGCSHQFKIFVEVNDKPEAWDSCWNYRLPLGGNNVIKTYWGYTRDNYNFWKNFKIISEEDIRYSEIDNVDIDWAIDTAGTLYICGEGVITENMFQTYQDDITAVVMGKGIKRLSDRAFMEWPKLEKVICPDGLEEIGCSAFKRCYALKEIEIPDGLSIIRLSAFEECTNLESVLFLGTVKQFGNNVFEKCVNLKSISIPNGIEELPHCCFYKCENLENVLLPESLKVIKDQAFYHCSKLKNITIPNTVTSIEQWAFAETGLEEIIIPESVNNIGRAVFKNCKITFLGDAPTIESDSFYNVEGWYLFNNPTWASIVNDKTNNRMYELDWKPYSNAQIKSITVSNSEENVFFIRCNSDDFSKLVLKVEYQDGFIEEIDSTKYVVVGRSSTQSEEKYIKIKYKDFSEKISYQLQHEMEYHEAKAATYFEDGNTEYWSCSLCNKYFKDAQGKIEIEKDSWIISKDKIYWGYNENSEVLYIAPYPSKEIEACGATKGDFYKFSNFLDGVFNVPWYSYRNEIKKIVFLDKVSPEFVRCWFYNLAKLESIENINNLDTSNLTDMMNMFSGCSSLSELDLSSFDTSNVTDMSCMFDGCNELKELDLSKFDTSKVTDMSSMFSCCSKLTELDLSDFDTSNVTRMSYMFGLCSSLNKLDVSKFDTSKVTDMPMMFEGCKGLTELDLSSFDMTKATYGADMFFDCSSLQKMKTPKNVTIDIELPGTWYDGQKNAYSSFPKSTQSYYLMKRFFIKGDVNNDGQIDASDVTALARHVAKLTIISDQDILVYCCDTNGDGDVDAADVTHLARYVAKLISVL